MHFINQLTVNDKENKAYVHLSPWPEQLRVIKHILDEDSLVIVKARQLGISTIIMAAMFTKAFLTSQPLNIVVLSHKQASSEHLLSMAILMYERLPEEIKEIHPARITKSKIHFLNTGVTITARSAEEKGGLRSFSCTHLVLTEFSLAPRPEELLAAGLAALGHGQLIVEGTAEYLGDGLQRMYDDSVRGKTGLVPIFINWHTHPRHLLTVQECLNYIPTDEDKALMDKYNLSINRIAFYSKQRTILGDAKTRTQYPFSYEDAYSQLPNMYISDSILSLIEQIDTPPNAIHYFQEPVSSNTYVIGVDPSAGVNKDFASVHVLNARTLQVVAVYRSKCTPIPQLATIIGTLSVKYNKAIVNSESNNKCGGYLLAELIKLQIPLFKIKGEVWVSTKTNKVHLYEEMRKALADNKLKQLDKFTYIDLRNVQTNDDGLPDKDTLDEGHFDGGDSLSLAIYAATRIPLSTSTNFWTSDWSKRQ